MNVKSGSTAEQRLPIYISRSRQSTEANKTGAWRIMCPEYQEKTPPCSVACPVGEDIAKIQILTARGRFKEAWETILAENPFPSVCGRVCYHPCEASCNRRELDQAIAIQMMERFLADTANRYGFKASFEEPEPKKEKIAIVGSGPSGLSAAYFLCRLGYTCDVFEEKSEPGGVLRWGIPGYRLPTDVLKREIRFIENSGVTVHCDYNVSHALLEKMAGQYDAVFLGCGFGRDLRLKIPGERYAIEGTEFLSRAKNGDASRLQGPVAVLGGGNTAVDAARCVARLGGEPVIIYRRRRKDIPAFPEEVKMAMEEGVKVLELHSPVSIERKDTEYLLTLQKMKVTDLDGFGNAVVQPHSAHRERISVATVIKAIGREAVDFRQGRPGKGEDILSLDNCVMSFGSTGFVRVFGGDPVIETKSVADAAASGKLAAIALDIYFNQGRHAIIQGLKECAVGQGPPYSMAAYVEKESRTCSNQVVTFESINTDYFPVSPRIEQPRLLREERVNSFSEINLKVSARSSITESERCFNCGTCNQCDNCYIFCPEVAVILDESHGMRHINYDYCKGCGLCVVECPRNAMVLKEEVI